MGPLKVFAVALALGLTVPASADDVSRWRPFTAEASARFGVPIDWIERVMRVESGGRTGLMGRPITSPKGAMGLMQVMPTTWAAMRASYGLGHDPYDPHDNILAGTAYLRSMFDRFGYPGLFGAYNAGPGRYAASLQGRRLPLETRTYLAAMTGQESIQAWTTASSLAPIVKRLPPTPRGFSPDASGLFVTLSPR